MTNIIQFFKRLFHHDETSVPEALLRDIGFTKAWMYLP